MEMRTLLRNWDGKRRRRRARWEAEVERRGAATKERMEIVIVNGGRGRWEERTESEQLPTVLVTADLTVWGPI